MVKIGHQKDIINIDVPKAIVMHCGRDSVEINLSLLDHKNAISYLAACIKLGAFEIAD